MSVEENKALIRRMYELMNRRQIDEYIELIADDCIIHLTDGNWSRSQEKEMGTKMTAAFPDGTATIEDMVAEGDKVAFRVTYRMTHQGKLWILEMRRAH